MNNERDDLGRGGELRDEHADRRQQTVKERLENADAEAGDAGAYLGSEPELAAETIPGGVQRRDERVAGTATQSTGPAGRGAIPDSGSDEWPEGHREGRAADDDMIRRKG